MAHDPTILLGGPDFDLSLELGAVGDDAHVAAALSALWACPLVDGPWTDAGAIGVTEKKGSISEWLDTKRWRFGLLRMDSLASSLPFVVHCIREQKASAEQLAAKIQFGIQTQQPSDWLTLGIPIGVLVRHGPLITHGSLTTSHGFETSALSWLVSLIMFTKAPKLSPVLWGRRRLDVGGTQRQPAPMKLTKAILLSPS